MASQLESVGAPLLSPVALPRLLVEAIVATEDERFFVEPGVDPLAVARAAAFDAGHHCWCQGASTITEQLVKLVYLAGSDKGVSKLVDMTVALKVNSVLDKNRILADYLSLVPTGSNIFGMSEAACTYFGRPLGDLALPDYALLAGLVQAPGAYNPLLHLPAALKRRQEVLDAMRSEHFITSEQESAASETVFAQPASLHC